MATNSEEAPKIDEQSTRATLDHMRSAQNYQDCLQLLNDQPCSTDQALGNIAWLAMRSSLQAYGYATRRPCANSMSLLTIQKYLNIQSTTPTGILDEYAPISPGTGTLNGIGQHMDSIHEDLEELRLMSQEILEKADMAWPQTSPGDQENP